MKIATHNDGAVIRGSERQLLLIARGLVGRNHEVAASCRAGSAVEAALAEAGVRTTGVRPSGDLDLYHAIRFSRWLSREKPDVLLLTSWKRVPVAVAAARGARVPRIVLRLGLVRRLPASGPRLMRYRTAFERIDALVLNSQDAAKLWMEAAPWFDPRRVHIVHNAINAVCAAPLDRRTIGVPAEARLVFTAASLEKRKGLGTLLEAMARLPAGVHAAIAGDGPERDALRRQAADLGLQNRIHWLGFREDVPALLATSNAFVLPSRHDSFASSILEAMMAGLPIVTTAGTGVSYALEATESDGPAGWLVPPDVPEALAGAITEALSSDAVMRGAEARRRAREWFDTDRMVSHYETILQGKPVSI